jgi:hypothetical protein
MAKTKAEMELKTAYSILKDVEESKVNLQQAVDHSRAVSATDTGTFFGNLSADYKAGAGVRAAKGDILNSIGQAHQMIATAKSMNVSATLDDPDGGPPITIPELESMAYRLTSTIHGMSGDIASAKQAIHKAIELQEGEAHNHLVSGYIHESDDMQKALAAFQRAESLCEAHLQNLDDGSPAAQHLEDLLTQIKREIARVKNLLAKAKSKTVFIVLAILLGGLGVHQFYIGKTKLGGLQFVLTFLTCGIAGLWAWYEAFRAYTGKISDANGVPLR